MESEVLELANEGVSAAASELVQEVITQDVVDNVFYFLSSLQVELIVIIALLSLLAGLVFAVVLFQRWTA